MSISPPTGRERAVAVKPVVAVNKTALFVSRNGRAAAHVDNDQIDVLIVETVLPAVEPRRRLLVEHVKAAHTGQLRQTGVARERVILICAGTVYDKSVLLVRSKVIRQPDAEIGNVVAVFHAARLFKHFRRDAVNAAVHRFRVAAAADKSIQLGKHYAVLLHKTEDRALSVIVLIPVARKRLDLLRRVRQRGGENDFRVFKIRDLC